MTKGQDPKCFVPVAARLQAMCLYHDKSSHIGWEKYIAKMREELFWPRMGQSLKKYIRNCRQCVLGKSHTGRRAGLWQRGERPSSALDVWHIDHAGPLVKSHGCTQLLVVIDGFSKYCSLRPTRKKSTEDTIRALSLVFEQMGKPRRIIADRAAAFTSLTFQNYLADQEVQLHHIATGMPRGNGRAPHAHCFQLIASLFDRRK
jgi:transposase InsO family protein